MTKFDSKQQIWKILFIVFSVWTYFYPIAALIFTVFRYEVLITAPTAYLCIDLALLAAMLLCLFTQNPETTNAEKTVAAFFVPSVAVTCLCLTWRGITLFCGCVCVLLFLGSAVLVYRLFKKHRVLTALALGGFGMLFLICLALTAFLAWFNVSTVARAVHSPDDRCIAEVIVNDQGALGGETLVTVRENKELRFPILTIRKKASCLYTGRYGEFENMTLSWQSNDVLRIQDRMYTVSDTDAVE